MGGGRKSPSAVGKRLRGFQVDEEFEHILALECQFVVKLRIIDFQFGVKLGNVFRFGDGNISSVDEGVGSA